MSLSKEAIEKLNRGILTADAINGQTTEDDALIEEVIRIFSQVKTLLKAEQPEPKCKICSDKKPEGYIKWLIGVKEEDKALGHNNIQRTLNQEQELYKMYSESFYPCPACKAEQPPASDFTKDLRDEVKTLQLYAAADDTRGAFKFADIYKVCNLLDASQAENRQLKGEEPIPFAWYKDCPELAQKTMERLIERFNVSEASRGELVGALEGLINYHYHNDMGVKPKEYHRAIAAIEKGKE